jgi:hypothetical protein
MRKKVKGGGTVKWTFLFWIELINAENYSLSFFQSSLKQGER